VWAECQFLSFKPAGVSNERLTNSIQKNKGRWWRSRSGRKTRISDL